MTELLWHVISLTSQIPQNPHSSTPSPKACKGPQGPGSDAPPQCPSHHNPPGLGGKQKVWPKGQIFFQIHQPDLHLIPCPFSPQSKHVITSWTQALRPLHLFIIIFIYQVLAAAEQLKVCKKKCCCLCISLMGTAWNCSGSLTPLPHLHHLPYLTLSPHRRPGIQTKI